MEMIAIEELLEADIGLEEIKLKIACLVNKKLKELFPENYEQDSIVKIFIDISFNPMKIMATTNSDFIEGEIGKIKPNITKTEDEYYATPIIIIWAKPFKKPLMSLI